MCASRWSAVWPKLVAISLIGFGAAGCSDTGRFSDIFAPPDNASRTDTTGSIPPSAPAGHVESRPLPRVASAGDQGTSGGGRGMGSYQPGDVTGSLPPAPPPPRWTWEGGTPITVGPGETVASIARRHNVPADALMQANNITNPATVHAGQHLVIPRFRASTAFAPPATHIATTSPTVPTTTGAIGAPRTALAPTSGMHLVAPGETLHSIARLYGKPVMVLAKANNIPPDTMVKVGARIIIPDVRAQAAPAAPRAEAPVQVPARSNVAAVESPLSARYANPVVPPTQANPAETAEPTGGLTSFRWPAHGRVIAGFGPKPNGLQNDGINLAVPEGTPVKAAEDGVVAYAGNELKGYGNLVLVRHSNGYVTAYAHASEILVKRGDSIKRGQVIAHSGETGNVTSPQLHFEIRKGANPIDPMPLLSGG